MYDLVQHLKGPSHKSGNTLDLITTKRNALLKSNYLGLRLSDQNNIISYINMTKVSQPMK